MVSGAAVPPMNLANLPQILLINMGSVGLQRDVAGE